MIFIIASKPTFFIPYPPVPWRFYPHAVQLAEVMLWPLFQVNISPFPFEIIRYNDHVGSVMYLLCCQELIASHLSSCHDVICRVGSHCRPSTSASTTVSCVYWRDTKIRTRTAKRMTHTRVGTLAVSHVTYIAHIIHHIVTAPFFRFLFCAALSQSQNPYFRHIQPLALSSLLIYIIAGLKSCYGLVYLPLDPHIDCSLTHNP